MSRIILARGPVVDALKRYDPGLRVRFSHQKRKWAVDAPYKFDESNPREFLLPPVRFERVGDRKQDLWIEHLLPEYSERAIEYHDKRYVVCLAKHVDWRLFSAVINRDAQRSRGLMVGLLDETLEAKEAAKKREEENRKSERVYAAWDLFRFNRRKLGPGVEDGTGVSIKGMKI